MSASSYRLTYRSLLAASGIGGAATAAGVLRIGTFWATSGPSSYTAAWSSVDQHAPAPEWFQDAKFGIYYHWGVFSVPAFGNDWYPRNMHIGGSAENSHHIATYGDPSVWPYHNFINGARDKAGDFVQFAPKLTSAGGNWDPDAWAQLFVDAGAKFAGPVVEHHDGHTMWNSSANEWNSGMTTTEYAGTVWVVALPVVASPSPSISPSRSTSPSPSPTGGGSCRVTYVKNEWSGGVVANLTVTNTGTAAINGWALRFTFPGDTRVTSAWNATVTQSGRRPRRPAWRTTQRFRPAGTPRSASKAHGRPTTAIQPGTRSTDRPALWGDKGPERSALARRAPDLCPDFRKFPGSAQFLDSSKASRTSSSPWLVSAVCRRGPAGVR